MKRFLFTLTLVLVALVGCKKDPMPGQDATAFESPANCYIVSQAGTYSFKTVKGNSSESVGDVASAEVLWESFGTDVAPAVGDLISSVSYKDGHIVFKTTDKKGNAVITAKDADGNILWSWHIWMTDKPQEQEYYNNAGTVMDRNLGATSATPGDVGALGLLYQWGRKDPFLGSLSISDAIIAESTITWPSAVSSDSSNGTIAYATAHPTTYITANLGNEDWYYTGSSSTDNTRWTTSVKAKSIYDPCPAGWRVPDGGENGVWAKLLGLEEINYPFDTTRKGMNFSGKFGSDQTIWYPFAGFYTRYEGRLYFVGEYGAYWSASPCPVRTWSMYSLDLNPVIAIPDWDNVMPVDESSCATAMSVRCMKEGTAKTVKVSQIKLVGMPTEFTAGRSVTISAVITPDDATDKSVTFTSSNPEVATVECIQSENNYSLALLKAVGPGKATITATANGGSGVKAEAEVTVIPYTFTSPANCYIVTDAGTYTFKAVKGNSSESVGNIASSEVLWETFGTHETPEVGDLVKEVSYNNGEITFKATDRKGNAVIAAKDAAGNILWSWHIWLTDQPKEQVYYNNAGTMMDRNLGATSATPGDVGALGLLYQWGRKDPFLGSSSISSNTTAKSTITWPSAVSSDLSNGTIAYVIANPTTFIANYDINNDDSNYHGNNDWYYTGSSSTDDTRWTASDKAKSIYDPCPSGWRVPDGGNDGVWAKAIGSPDSFNCTYESTYEGFNFSGKFGSASTIWYPASGFRTNLGGSLDLVGESGYYWSASKATNNYRAHELYFYCTGNVYPSSYFYSRASGQSVRCVKE